MTADNKSLTFRTEFMESMNSDAIDPPMGILSIAHGLPMLTITKSATTIIRYHDGAVALGGTSPNDPDRVMWWCAGPAATATHRAQDGEEVTLPMAQIMLEAADRQGLTVHEETRP